MSVSEAIRRLPFEPVPFEPGHVWLAGAGPGGLGCLTLDVLSALTQADAVVYDALVNEEVLNAAHQAEHHYVGKRGGRSSTPQSEINHLLVRLAGEGRRVLRLKGGDPTIFSRGGEEALELARASIPFRFLSGVTSGFAALASAGIPATMRGINKAVIFATGHAADTANDLDWASLARTGQPLVIYMGMSNIEPITAALVKGGMPETTPAAVLVSATTSGERVVEGTVGDIAGHARQAGLEPPVIIAVGGIVGLRRELNRTANEKEASWLVE